MNNIIFNKNEQMKKILVFTGAGVSAESGIKTFRDYNGLWNDYCVEDVATPEAFQRNPELVLDFYNMRRRELLNVQPNDAHRLIAQLELNYDVTVITQNVDDLHERAGSKKVKHLHGELLKVRSTINPTDIKYWDKDLNLGYRCELGGQLRPHIVWFGEMLDEKLLQYAREMASQADYCIVVGTSLQVFPAAEIPYYTSDQCIVFAVDPNMNDIQLDFPENRLVRITQNATIGMLEVHRYLKKL